MDKVSTEGWEWILGNIVVSGNEHMVLILEESGNSPELRLVASYF